MSVIGVETRSFDDAGFTSGFPPEAEIGGAIYEYTPFCNGPDDTRRIQPAL